MRFERTPRSLLEALRREVPFLQLVPDDLYFGLDPSEFYFPQGRIQFVRETLEQKLGHHVMTYRIGARNDSPQQRHLCANLESAPLSYDALQVLRRFEDQYRPEGVVFVAYRKPVTLRNIAAL